MISLDASLRASRNIFGRSVSILRRLAWNSRRPVIWIRSTMSASRLQHFQFPFLLDSVVVPVPIQEFCVAYRDPKFSNGSSQLCREKELEAEFRVIVQMLPRCFS